MTPKVKQAPVDYKSAWENFTKWSEEDRKWYEDKISRTKAELAARGVMQDDPVWERAMSQIDAEYADKQAQLRQGATYQTLRQGLTAPQPGDSLPDILNRRLEMGAMTGTVTKTGENTYTLDTRKSGTGGIIPYVPVDQSKITDEMVMSYYQKKFGQGGDSLITDNAVNQVRGDQAKKRKPGYQFGTLTAETNPWMIQMQ